MAQEIVEIDVRAWLVRIMKNWYWFLLSAVVFGILGVYDYFSTTYKFEVKSEIMLREADNGSSFLPTTMVDVLGVQGKKLVDDEIAALTSRDIISRVVADMGLQVDYRKKQGLRWVGKYPSNDVMLVTSPMYLDTIQRTTKIDIKVRKNDYVVRVEYGIYSKSKHVVDDLTKPIETCAGVLCFDMLNPENVVCGAQYKLKVYPLPVSVSLYKNKVNVSTAKKDSKVIVLAATTDTPRREKEFIAKMIDLYNADAMSDKNMVAQNTAAFIEERLRILEDELVQAEETAVHYLEKYNLMNPWTEQDLFLEEDVEYRKQLADVETQINMMNYLCDFMENKAHADELLPAMFVIPTYQSQSKEQGETSRVGISNMSLITAIEDYNALIMRKTRGENVDSQLNAELNVLRANIVTTVKNMLNTLQIAKQDLDNHFVSANQLRSDMPEHIKTYEKMVREKRLKEKLYLLVYEQREENAMLLSSTIMPIKIITQSQVNPIPVSPKYMSILLLLLVGLVLPLGVMIAYDIVNNRVSGSSKDLEKRLKISLAGVLANTNNGDVVVVRDGENSVAAELFRTLRTNIRFMQPMDVKCPVILVTSSVNDEGKTYVATNLAVSMALLGKKVALVGMDLRKPTLATYLNLSSEGCLTNYLSDKAYTLDDAVVASSVKNLDVLPAGIVPPNPSELLQSDRVAVLFAELREHYDYVVVDSAPVALVSDTFLLSGVADTALYVVRANHTTFDMVEFVNKMHDQERLPKMVAVLNGVDAKKVGYGY